MRIDGEVVPDSTAIIAALERRFPDPPLYPADPDERRRALELEEFFDEHLGPWIRLVAWHDLRADPQRMGAVTERMVPGAMRPFGPARAGARWFGTTFVNLRYGARSDGAAEAARLRVVEALDRLERELDADGGEFLAGDAFSVADLTAAALFYPLVRPPEGPQVIQEMPATFEEWRAPLRERRGYRWVEQTFARHRHRRRAPVLV
jgi:glutathione S-transferase